MRALFMFATTVLIGGIGANSVVVLGFKHLSSDAGGSALAELAMIVVSWSFIAIFSAISFLAIATPVLPAMNDRSHAVVAATLGVATVFVAGSGLLGRFERWMWPEGGRIAWFATASIPGIVAAIAMISVSLAGSYRRTRIRHRSTS